MQGKYFDDWDVGQRYVTAGRTITETDVVMFAAMTGDYNELHTNRETMENNEVFGERIAHGLLGLAVAHGLFSREGYLDGTTVAFLGLESWQFKAPIFLGDTIRVNVEVVEKKAGRSKADRGVVKFHLVTTKQDQTVVQDGYISIMFWRNIGKTE